MKKLLAILLAAMMILSLAACDLGTTEDSDKDNPGTSQTDSQSGGNLDNTITDTGNNGGTQNTPVDPWSDPKYTEYTNGLEEPSFNYTIKGVLMDQLTINAEATEAEVSAWKQSLLDAGFEEYREGEQWGIKNATHNIQMNGFVNGIAYIYIGLEG